MLVKANSIRPSRFKCTLQAHTAGGVYTVYMTIITELSERPLVIDDDWLDSVRHRTNRGLSSACRHWHPSHIAFLYAAHTSSHRLSRNNQSYQSACVDFMCPKFDFTYALCASVGINCFLIMHVPEVSSGSMSLSENGSSNNRSVCQSALNCQYNHGVRQPLQTR